MSREQPRLIYPESAGGRATESLGCGRRDLMRWADRGGPLPSSLERHIRRCNDCAQAVRRCKEVHAGLTLLRTQTMPVGVVPEGQSGALRMLRRTERASKAALRMLQSKRNLTPWQRAQLQVTRLSMGAAAALLVLVVRTGVIGGIEKAHTTGTTLADRYYSQMSLTDEMQNPRDMA